MKSYQQLTIDLDTLPAEVWGEHILSRLLIDDLLAYQEILPKADHPIKGILNNAWKHKYRRFFGEENFVRAVQLFHEIKGFTWYQLFANHYDLGFLDFKTENAGKVFDALIENDLAYLASIKIDWNSLFVSDIDKVSHYSRIELGKFVFNHPNQEIKNFIFNAIKKADEYELSESSFVRLSLLCQQAIDIKITPQLILEKGAYNLEQSLFEFAVSIGDVATVSLWLEMIKVEEGTEDYHVFWRALLSSVYHSQNADMFSLLKHYINKTDVSIKSLALNNEITRFFGFDVAEYLNLEKLSERNGDYIDVFSELYSKNSSELKARFTSIISDMPENNLRRILDATVSLANFNAAEVLLTHPRVQENDEFRKKFILLILWFCKTDIAGFGSLSMVLKKYPDSMSDEWFKILLGADSDKARWSLVNQALSILFDSNNGREMLARHGMLMYVQSLLSYEKVSHYLLSRINQLTNVRKEISVQELFDWIGVFSQLNSEHPSPGSPSPELYGLDCQKPGLVLLNKILKENLLVISFGNKVEKIETLANLRYLIESIIRPQSGISLSFYIRNPADQDYFLTLMCEIYACLSGLEPDPVLEKLEVVYKDDKRDDEYRADIDASFEEALSDEELSQEERSEIEQYYRVTKEAIKSPSQENLIQLESQAAIAQLHTSPAIRKVGIAMMAVGVLLAIAGCLSIGASMLAGSSVVLAPIAGILLYAGIVAVGAGVVSFGVGLGLFCKSPNSNAKEVTHDHLRSEFRS